MTCSAQRPRSATSTPSRGTRTWRPTIRTLAPVWRVCWSAPELVRDRHPAVAAERLRADLDPRGRLPALVLGQVDKADHRVHDVGGQAAADQLLAALVLLYVGLEDLVEHVVGRQRVFVALVRS